MYNSLLFLDFDGTYWPRCSENPKLFHEFADFIKHHPGLAVVISSNWRFSRTLKELRGYFHPDIESRVIDTLQLEDDREPRSRQKLIESYVYPYSEAQPGAFMDFVVLDDNPLLFEPGWPHLVLCNYSEGITHAILHGLANRLSLVG